MQFSASADVDSPPQRVWSIYTAVELWPDWTGSVTSVVPVDPGPLALGSRVRIKQPKLPAAVWKVTEYDEGRSWTWVATGPGVLTTATHIVTPRDGGTTVRALLRQQGPLGSLLGKLAAGLTDRYLAMECEGLKARAEQV